jgi:hypothetical protein
VETKYAAVKTLNEKDGARRKKRRRGQSAIEERDK